MANQLVQAAHDPAFYALLDDVIHVQEAAERFSYHPRTIQRWCDEGRVAARQNPRGQWLIARQSLELFVATRARKAS